MQLLVLLPVFFEAPLNCASRSVRDFARLLLLVRLRVYFAVSLFSQCDVCVLLCVVHGCVFAAHGDRAGFIITLVAAASIQVQLQPTGYSADTCRNYLNYVYLSSSARDGVANNVVMVMRRRREACMYCAKQLWWLKLEW